MFKSIILLIVINSFNFTANYSQYLSVSDNNQTPKSKKTTKISVSKTVVKILCSTGGSRPQEGESCDENMSIEVSAFLDNTNDSLIYEYEVTGGRIIGQGKNVFWNLENVSPGTYQIFARLKDSQSRILDISETKTITVEECNCIADCFCPDFDIDSPDISGKFSKVKKGKIITFWLNASSLISITNSDEPICHWTVSGGEIIEGQDTPKIKIKVSSSKDEKELKVTLKLSESYTCFGVCPDEVSKTFVIADEKDK